MTGDLVEFLGRPHAHKRKSVADNLPDRRRQGQSRGGDGVIVGHQEAAIRAVVAGIPQRMEFGRKIIKIKGDPVRLARRRGGRLADRMDGQRAQGFEPHAAVAKGIGACCDDADVILRLDRAPFERLDRELERLRERPVLVCLHHPPLPVGSAWLDAVGLLNGPDVLAVIDRHPSVRAVLGGHVHQAFEGLHRDVRVLTTPSTCAQFTPGTERCVMDLRPPGYRWLELCPDGTLRTEVRWLQDWDVHERPPDDRF